MRQTRFATRCATAAAALAIFAAVPAFAQPAASDAAEEGGTVSPPMGGGMMQGGGYGPGNMGPGMMRGYGPGNMGPDMMQGGGYMGPGMMQGYGQGNMGPGMMQGYGQGEMGPGMMQGYRHMMGRGSGPGAGPYGYVRPPLNLSVADVQGFFANWIARSGNPNLKVGQVTEKDKQTIAVDVVTKDGSLVRQFEVDRATGFFHPAG